MKLARRPARVERWPAERLFCLIATLADSPAGLSRFEIVQRLAEFYCPDGEPAPDPESLRRMFERDKALAKDLGFVIRIVEEADQDETEQDGQRYVIDARDIPSPSLTLTPTQRDLLAATAGTLLEDPVFPMREELATAIHRLLLASGEVTKDRVPTCRLVLGDKGPGLQSSRKRIMAALADAVHEKKTLRIEYTDLAGARSHREIDPYGLVYVRGEWRLAAFCHVRGAMRVFALHRISSVRAVRRSGRQARFRLPARFDAAAVVHVPPWRYSVHDPVEVTLAADLDFEWQATRVVGASPARRRGRTVFYEIEAANTPYLVELALRYGPRIRIAAPAALVQELRAAVTRMGTRHGWGRVQAQRATRRSAAMQPAGTPPSGPGVGTRRRIARYTFLVSYLAKHPVTRLDRLARIMDMPLADLITTLERLGTCGVYPSTTGRLFDVSIDADEGLVHYMTDPTMVMEAPVALDQRECVALLLGLKWLRDCATPPFDFEADRVMDRVLSMHSADLSRIIDDLTRRISVGGGDGPDWDTFHEVSRAVLGRRKLRIDYYTMSRDSHSERTIRPYVVVSKLGLWYVIGYCEERRDVRTFRIDRIRSARLARESFDPPRDFDPRAFLEWGIFPDLHPPEHQRVVVAFDPGWIAANEGREGREFLGHLAGNELTLAVEPSAHEGFLAWLSALTTRFAVVHPPELAERLEARRARLLSTL